MSQKRKKYSEAQNTFLVTQVKRVCPLCSEPLFYRKGGRSFKKYELAHIFPLNPTEDELSLLAQEKRLNDDINHEDNIIPLCLDCHEKFDKPRTLEEYRQLYDLKKRLIERSGQEEIWKKYAIEKQISEILDAIYNDAELDNSPEISFNAKTINEKLDNNITRPTKRKIKNNVGEYYLFIKKQFASLNQSDGGLSDLISSQFKTFYLKQKNMGFEQQVIFENIVSWVEAQTSTDTIDGAEIITAFFIQNCEVFE